MNRREGAYEKHLELLKAAGEVRCWWFEAVTLKCGPDLRYTPDFLVMHADDTLSCDEVKATAKDGEKFRAEEDAMIKIRAAAQQFPFRFRIVWESKTRGWQAKEI